MLAAGVEIWAFLAGSLWVLPRFKRTWSLVISASYCVFELVYLFTHAIHSSSVWTTGSIAAVSALSGALAFWYFWKNGVDDFI
jgi:hypothetical protein